MRDFHINSHCDNLGSVVCIILLVVADNVLVRCGCSFCSLMGCDAVLSASRWLLLWDFCLATGWVVCVCVFVCGYGVAGLANWLQFFSLSVGLVRVTSRHRRELLCHSTPYTLRVSCVLCSEELREFRLCLCYIYRTRDFQNPRGPRKPLSV